MATIQKVAGKRGTYYKITVTSGRDASGKQNRRCMNWTPPKGMGARQAQKEVKQVAYEFEHRFDVGFDVGNRQTFAEYSQYVIDLKSDPDREGGVKHNTILLYQRLRRNLLPYIGSVPVRDITAPRLNALYTKLGKMKAKKGIRRKNGVVETIETDHCISPKTVREYYSFISAVLEQAVTDRIIPYNPAHNSRPPRKKPHEVRSYEPEEIQAMRAALKNEPLQWQVLFDLLLVSGCRRGEAAGLEWSRVDWKRSQIDISKNLCYAPDRGCYLTTPKTGKSVRFVGLPAQMMDSLRALQREQAEARLRLGERWKESDFVFTGEEGGPINPSYITSFFRKWSEKNNLPHLNPHALRHTMASMLIAQGNDVVVVSERLGHSDVSTTLNIYSHAVQESRARATECMGNFLKDFETADAK